MGIFTTAIKIKMKLHLGRNTKFDKIYKYKFYIIPCINSVSNLFRPQYKRFGRMNGETH